MIRTVARLAAVAAAYVIMLAVVPSTASATARTATIQILSQAQLVSEPGPTFGDVVVTVEYSCGPAFGGAASLNITVTQPKSKGQNLTGGTVTCDDVKHKVTEDIGPGAPAPFEPGSASAIAQIGNLGVSFATAQAEITIK
jgi:hypothetical protein